ncbi:SH3 domain-containing protein [Pseudotabrizicola alkalilacus]|uniref:SH3 domain-containing protein n=1 Tax=Pseudotabrizicola alkalilacus TaxID=2305252 RepID=A0A411Z5H3_9RHOB|nr:SH3 domain-containing protein [Pseudotabrizicola alkalilacus]RGP38311.1 SH3 domain-containing protein [Pseudotabrizicola alkalilacus]
MIRLLLLLCAGIFVTLQIGGQDRGQTRFGLMAAEKVPVPAPTVRVAETAPVQASSGAGIVPVVFAPAQPLIKPVAQPKAVVPVEAAVTVAEDVKYVTGRSVNVRSGPSTQNAVVGRLTRGEAVSVISDEGNGWARVRVEGDGIDGYMAISFLADAP